jgi:hypothetical protein
LTTAQYGIFSGAGGTGLVFTAAGAPMTGLIANAPNTPGHFMALALGTLPTYVWNTALTVYFRCTQAQGAAATVDIMWQYDTYN